MGKCKRNLPSDHTDHFEVKSSLNSFAHIIEGSSMREQESTIAGYHRKRRGEPREVFERRDDSDLGNNKSITIDGIRIKMSDGFISRTNKLTCLEIRDLSAKYHAGENGRNCPSKIKEFRDFVGLYVRSLRELGNICLLHPSPAPLSAKKHFIGDAEVQPNGKVISAPEGLMDKKQRLRFKKSVQLKHFLLLLH